MICPAGISALPKSAPASPVTSRRLIASATVGPFPRALPEGQISAQPRSRRRSASAPQFFDIESILEEDENEEEEVGFKRASSFNQLVPVAPQLSHLLRRRRPEPQGSPLVVSVTRGPIPSVTVTMEGDSLDERS